MKRLWTLAAAGAVAVSYVLPSSASDDMQDQLQDMQDRMAALEDQLEREKSRSEEQQQMIERAGLAEVDEFSAASALSSFVEQTEIGGWVAASYFFNTNQPNDGADFDGDGGSGGGNSGTFGANPFHPDHNSFNLDQVWFEIFKPASEEGRGGFGIEIAYGKTADALRSADSSNGDLPVVYQAYAEWLAPIGPGLNIKAGRFATLVGAEVAQTPYNFNITRGLVYGLQPINHVGALASMELDNGLDFAAGIANTALGNANTDTDDNKAFLWRVGWTGDTVGVGVNGVYGSDSTVGDGGATNRNADKTGLVDVLVSWDPSESLSTYINADYVWVTDSSNGSGTSPDAWGISAAGRYAITEQTGFAIRGEYIRSNDAYIFGGGAAFGGIGAAAKGMDQDVWSLTGTFDHLLTENLTVRAEVRYEQGKSDGDDNIFYIDGDDDNLEKSQVLLGVEMYYRF